MTDMIVNNNPTLSIIDFIQKRLCIENRNDLRYQPHILRFIELLLCDEMRARFDLRQYIYAANFIYGRNAELNAENVIEHLSNLKIAFETRFTNADSSSCR